MLKPEIVLHRFDPLYAATRRHFDSLRCAAGVLAGSHAAAGVCWLAVTCELRLPAAGLPGAWWRTSHSCWLALLTCTLCPVVLLYWTLQGAVR